jgi:hypothetical protein
MMQKWRKSWRAQSAERSMSSSPVPSERIEDWTIALKSLSARGEILVPEMARFAPVRGGTFQHQPTLIVAGGPLDFRQRIIKRLFDVIVSLGAIIALSPVLLITALAIKLTSPGPVLFKQARLGRDARPFKILKFRSMRAEMSDHTASQLTQKDDPRITPIGAFIRKTSIDELPQLFNVLIGDMSIVGPRPHAAGRQGGGFALLGGRFALLGAALHQAGHHRARAGSRPSRHHRRA